MVEHELKAGVYQHFKGRYYLVLGAARHSETEEWFVAYVPLGIRPGPRITVRPYEMFFDQVEREGKTHQRFRYVGQGIADIQEDDHGR